MNLKFIILLVSLGSIPYFFDIAFSQSNYDINIPTGAADKNAPFHWQSEKDGDAMGRIEIMVMDVIYWNNADTVLHIVASGNPSSGQDNNFQSGPILPGSSFSHQFTEKGEFPFYCALHPWKTGIVVVKSGLNVLPNVGSDVGDGLSTFDIEYGFNRLIKSAKIDPKTNSIQLEIQGKSNSDNNSLKLFLPPKLIDGISKVSIDGLDVKFAQESNGDFTVITVNSVLPNSKIITINGSHVVPEFSQLSMGVLVFSLVAIIFVSRNKLRLPKY